MVAAADELDSEQQQPENLNSLELKAAAIRIKAEALAKEYKNLSAQIDSLKTDEP